MTEQHQHNRTNDPENITKSTIMRKIIKICTPLLGVISIIFAAGIVFATFNSNAIIQSKDIEDNGKEIKNLNSNFTELKNIANTTNSLLEQHTKSIERLYSTVQKNADNIQILKEFVSGQAKINELLADTQKRMLDHITKDK